MRPAPARTALGEGAGPARARPAPCRSALRWLFPLCIGAALLLGARPARADMSSWLSVGLGGAQLRYTGQEPVFRLAMPINVGVGSPASAPIIVGGGVRVMPYFGQGTDFAAYLRTATQGYAVGGFGVALDAGGYSRAFGGGSSGFLGVLNLGAPWGVVASLMYERGNSDAQVFGATLGIDFLRLTVHRLSGEQEWPNVNPAYRPQ
jgi:hypothetical protein